MVITCRCHGNHVSLSWLSLVVVMVITCRCHGYHLPSLSGVSQVLSAGSVFLLYEFNSPDQTVLLTCLFNAVTAPIFNMVDVLIPGLYPTQSRSFAVLIFLSFEVAIIYQNLRQRTVFIFRLTVSLI